LRSLIRSLKVGAVALMAMVSLGVVAAPAQASTSCDSTAICFWTSTNYTGSRLMSYDVTCTSFNYPFAESISSIKNRAGKKMRVYNSYGCSFSGATLLIQSGANLATLPALFDNSILSVGPDTLS